MPLSSAWELYEALAASRLLDEAQLAEVEARLSADQRTAPFLLAEELVERGMLNAWQASQLLEGRRQFALGPYRLVSLVGQGGMGAVYTGEHSQTGELHALKVLAEELVEKPESVARFRREARAASMLKHPNVVRAHECGNEGATHYLAMELVDGKDLNEWVTKFGRLPIAWACECVRQAAIGLQHAHEQGMVHRDIKPGNLLIVAKDFASPPVVKILDMGLARIGPHEADNADAPTNLTQTGMILGTPDYIAPEQARDTRLADIRSDIYSLGCTLFKLLTGEVPFEGTSAMQKLVARTRRDAPRVRTLRKDVPPELDEVVARMLAREPTDRYQIPDEVAVALAPFAAGTGMVDDAAGDTPSTALPPQAMNDFFAELAEKARPDDRTVLHRAAARSPTPAPAPSPLLASDAEPAEEPMASRRIPWRMVAAVMIGAMALTLVAGGISWCFSRPTTLVIDWPLDQRAHSLPVAEGSSAVLDGYYEGFAPEDFGRPGAIEGPGYAAYFDGRDNRVVVPDSTTIDLTGDMTVEFWMNKSGEPGDWSRMVGKGDRRDRTFGVWDDRGMGRGVFFQQYKEEGASGLNVSSKTRLETGQWHHVAATVAGNINSIYIDGKLEGSAQRPATAAGSFDPLTFGAADFHAPYHGLLDEVSLYEHAVSAERIAAHYRAGQSGLAAYRKAVNTDKPIGHWRLDDSIESPARLTVDGRRIAVTDTNPIDVAVEPGRHRVRIDRRGYEPFDQVAEQHRGRGEPLAITFQPLAIDAKRAPGAWQSGLVMRDWLSQRQQGQEQRTTELAALRKEAEGAGRSKQPGELRDNVAEFMLRWPATDEAAAAADLLGELPDPLDKLAPLGVAAGTSDHGSVVQVFGDQKLHHVAQVYALAFSPDGGTLACADVRSQIDLWDVARGARRRTLVGHGAGVYSLAWRPQGRHLASAAGGTPGEIRLWDTETGETVATATAHSGVVHALAFSGDGNRLASGAFDGRIHLWDAADNQLRLQHTIDVGERQVTSVAFSPDGATLAVASRPGPDVLRFDLRGDEPKELAPLVGLTNTVESVAWSPDGALLAATSTDQTVRVWNVEGDEPREAWVSPQHESGVYTTAFSADGRWLATTAWGNGAPVRLWNAATGKLAHEFQGHVDGAVRLAFAPVGNRLASGGRDHRLRIWDTETLSEHLPPDGQFGRTTAAAFSPSGDALAVGATDRTVAVYDPLSGEQRRFATAHTDDVLCLAWRPDGRRIASGSADRTIRLWRVDDGGAEAELTGAASSVTALAFSPDGTALYSLADNGGVMRWDLTSTAPQGEPLLTGALAGGAALAMLPDGASLAAVGSGDREVRRWDLTGAKASLVFPLEGLAGYRAVAFSPAGDAVAAGSTNGWIYRWGLPLGRAAPPRGGNAGITALAYSPDGRWIASGSGDGELKLWDAEGEQPRQVFRLAPPSTGPVSAVSFAPSGRYLAAVNPDGGVSLLRLAVPTGPIVAAKPSPSARVPALDALDPRKVTSIGPATADAGPVVARFGSPRLAHWRVNDGSFTGTPAFSPDGAWLASGGADGIVRLWDAAKGNLARTLAQQSSLIRAVAFTPDFKRLITAGYNSQVQVYDVPTGRELLSLNSNGSGLDSLALSADGRTLVTGSYDNAALVWDLQNGKELFRLKGHQQAVHGVALHPDGRTIATAGDDGLVKLWDATTGESQTTFESPGLALRGIAFSPDGQTLVAGATNGMLRVWRPFEPPPECELGPWHAFGPFQDRDFQTAHPPEQAIDLKAEHSDGDRKLTWRQVEFPTGQPIDLRSMFEKSDNCCAYFHQQIECPRAQRVNLSLGSDDQVAIWLNGELLWRSDSGRAIVYDQDYVTLDLSRGVNDLLLKVGNINDAWLLEYRFGRDAARTLVGHNGIVPSVVFRPDGGQLLTGGHDGAVRTWDTSTWRTTSVLRGPVGSVVSAVYSPDGQTIAATGYHSTICLWDAARGREKFPRAGHAGAMTALLIGPEGDGAISAGRDGTLRWWDLAGRETRPALAAHVGPVLSADRSPDGALVATGGEEGVVRIWDATTAILLHAMHGHSGGVREVRFHPGGQAVACCGYDGAVRLWTAVDGVAWRSLPTLTSTGANCLAFSPRGDRLLTGDSNGTTRTIRLTDGTEDRVMTWDDSSVLCVAWRPDGKQVAVGLANFAVRLRAADGSGKTLALDGHGNHVTSLAYSPDGRTLASGARDGTVRLWDTRDGAERQLFRLSPQLGEVSRVTFQPDGRHLAVACGDGTGVILRAGLPEAKSDSLPDEPQRREQLAAALIEADSLVDRNDPTKAGDVRAKLDTLRRKWLSTPEALAAAARLNRVPGPLDALPSSTATRELSFAPTIGPVAAPFGDNHLASGADWVGSLAFSPDGGTIFTGGGDGEAVAWDSDTGALRRRFIGHTNAIRRLALSPDGGMLATTSFDQTARVWDTRTGRQLWLLGDNPAPLHAIAFDAIGARLATGGDGPIRIWDVATGKVLREMKGNFKTVAALDFSPDGRWLASGSQDRILRVWDSSTGEAIQTLKDHRGYVTAVRFSPDGHYLAAGDHDAAVRLWNTTDWTEARLLSYPGRPVEAIAWRRDGQQLASVHHGGLLRLWNPETGDVAATRVLERDPAMAVEFSPDGRTIATGGYGMRARLWDAETGAERIPAAGHLGAINAVAVDLAGTLLATAGQDGTVHLWDARKQTARAVLTGHDGPVLDLALAPNGKALATAGQDGTVRLWETADGRQRPAMIGHRNAVTSVVFSADGRTIASGGDITVRLWDAASGLARTILKGPREGINAIALSPDGRTAAALAGSTLWIWDIGEGRVVRQIPQPNGPCPALGFALDGRTVYCAAGAEIIGWDVGSGDRVRSFVGHGRQPLTIDALADGRTLLSASLDGTVRLWDIETNQLRQTFDFGRSTWRTKARPALDSRHVAVASGDGTALLLRIAPVAVEAPSSIAADGPRPNSPLDALPPPDESTAQSPLDPPLVRMLGDQRLRHWRTINKVAYAPDGAWLAAADGDWDDWQHPGEVRLWDAETGALQGTLRGPATRIASLSISPDGQRLVTGDSSFRVRLWDVNQRREIRNWEMPFQHIYAVAFRPNGKEVAAGGNGPELLVWDVESGKELHRIKGFKEEIAGLAYSRDGRWLATAEGSWGASSRPNVVRVWDADTMKPRATLKGHRGMVNAVEFFPDGDRLASASLDRTVRVWDIGTSKQILEIADHADLIHGIAIDARGERVASTSWDGSVRVWHAATGRRLHVLTGCDRAVHTAAFSPDGRRLAAGGTGRRVHVWNLETGADVDASAGPAGVAVGAVALGDGATAVSGHEGGQLYRWDVVSGQASELAERHPYTVRALASLPAHGLFASGGGDGLVRIWDASTLDLVRSLAGHRGEVLGLAVGGDGRTLVSCGTDGLVKIWDAVAGLERLTVYAPSPLWAAGLSRDGRYLAAGGDDGLIHVWRAADGAPLAALSGHVAQVTSLAFAGDGGTLYSAARDGTLRCWDTRQFDSGVPRLRPPVHITRNVDRFEPIEAKFVRFTALATNALSPCLEELEVYTAGAKRTNVASQKRGARATASGEMDAAHPVEKVNDGQQREGSRWAGDKPNQGWVQIELAAPATIDRVVWSRDRAGQRTDHFPTQYRIEVALKPGQWTTVATSVDRRPYVPGAAATIDQQAHNLLAARGAEVERALEASAAGPQAIVPAHSNGVLSLAISSDGRQLATSGRDGLARLWTLDGNGPPRPVGWYPLVQDTQRINQVVFTPDGRHLLTAAVDGSLRLLRPVAGEPRLAVLCGRDQVEETISQQPGYSSELIDGTRFNGWNGTTSHAWYSADTVTFEVNVPSGTAGVLHLFTIDPDALERRQKVIVEGREIVDSAVAVAGEWTSVPIASEDTADGRIHVDIDNTRPEHDVNAVVSMVVFTATP